MRVTAERNSRCSEDVLLLFDRQFRVERESGGGFLGSTYSLYLCKLGNYHGNLVI